MIAETYEITRLLGQGGMGAVWEAKHLRLPGKRVVVKVLLFGATDAVVLARFRREAEIGSRLGHPNIVQVLDFNTLADGTPYIVLELLQGESLAARLLRGPLPLEQVKAIVTQVGSALAAAHREGIVHRDLKPDNVFLCPTDLGGEVRDVVKVLDFGISKIRGSKTVLTQDAALLGTPQYMAPEQATGRNDEIDVRTDVFAFGAMTFEMLAGRAPFTGDTLAAVIHAIVYTPTPPLAAAAKDVPPPIVAAIERALDKNRDARFPDVNSFVKAVTSRSLATAPGSEPTPASGAGRAPTERIAREPSRRPVWIALGLGVARVGRLHDLEAAAARARRGPAHDDARTDPHAQPRPPRPPSPPRTRTRPTPHAHGEGGSSRKPTPRRRRSKIRRARTSRPKPQRKRDALPRGGARSRRGRGGARRGQAGRRGPPGATQPVRAEDQPRLRGDRPCPLRAGGSRQRQGGARPGGCARPLPSRARLWQTGRRASLRMRTPNVRWLLLATLLLPAAARADAPVEPGRVYVGGDGITIAVVPLKPRTDNKVLVRVTGSRTVFDDKVIPHKRGDGDGGKVAYSTTYRGRDWYTITVPSSAEARPIPIYLPGRRDVTVKLDDRKSAELKLDDVYRAYQKQQGDGTLQALAAFNRKVEIARAREAARGDDRYVRQALRLQAAGQRSTGHRSATTTSRSSPSPATAASRSTRWRACARTRTEAKRTITAAIKSFACTMGPAMQLDLAGTTLNWTTSRSARNMGDFARKYLEKKL